MPAQYVIALGPSAFAHCGSVLASRQKKRAQNLVYRLFLAKDSGGDLFSAGTPSLEGASFGGRAGDRRVTPDIILSKKEPLLSLQEANALFAERNDARKRFLEQLFSLPPAVSRCIEMLERALSPKDAKDRSAGDGKKPKLTQVLDVSTRYPKRMQEAALKATETIPAIRAALLRIEKTGWSCASPDSRDFSPEKHGQIMADRLELSRLVVSLDFRTQVAKGIFRSLESEDTHIVGSNEVAELRATLRQYDSTIELAVRKNLPLVKWVIDRFHPSRPKRMDYSELFQEGTLGLITAAERFDLSRGAMFSTFAVWWIRQRVKKCLKDFASKQAHSLNQRMNVDDQGNSVESGSLIVDRRAESPKAKALDRIIIEETLRRAGLSDRDVHVLVHRALGFTLDEIGQQLGLTRERVRQIEATANRRAMEKGA